MHSLIDHLARACGRGVDILLEHSLEELSACGPDVSLKLRTSHGHVLCRAQQVILALPQAPLLAFQKQLPPEISRCLSSVEAVPVLWVRHETAAPGETSR